MLDGFLRESCAVDLVGALTDLEIAHVDAPEPPLRALLARLGIESIPDDVVVAYKREQVKAAEGSNIIFALAWLTSKVVNLTSVALLVFSISTLFVGVIGAIFEETWGILAVMGLLGFGSLVILVLVFFPMDNIFVKPRARWHEVPYGYLYQFHAPDWVRDQVLRLRQSAFDLQDGLDVTILELRQAEVRLDPIAVVSSGDERYAIVIWG